jgi:hypothetical protein
MGPLVVSKIAMGCTELFSDRWIRFFSPMMVAPAEISPKIPRPGSALKSSISA